jgi:serpin B
MPPGAVAPDESSTKADVRAANGVALSLYGRVKRPQGNACVSGTSLRHALGVAYLGAKGETARELAKALSFATPDVASGLGAQELEDWQKVKPDGGDLAIATRVWVDESVSLAPSFLGLALAYGAPAERLGIASDPEKARNAMNTWVSERTGGKIPELLAKGTLDARSRMLVTNAIYLKARWAEPFPKDATKDAPFRVDGSKSVPVPTMNVTGSFRYAADGGNKIVELRYDGTPLAMMLVVPDDAAGIARTEGALSVDTLERWTKALAQRKVSLAMPRFTFTAGGSMNDALRDMGIRTAFGDGADFSGLVDPSSDKKGGRLSIQQVVQRTFLAVDEVGTEAAAATGVVMRTTSLDMSSPVEVKADRPFLFVLRDVTRGRVLFVGRVSDPRASAR